MESIILEIDKNKIELKARDFFLKSSGLFSEDKRFAEMRASAERIKEEIKGKVDIRAVVSYFDEFQMMDNTLTVQGRTFTCKPFYLIRPEAVRGVYLYAITAGDWSMDGREIMDQLYADMWGTSYLDAARKILPDIILEDFFSKGIFAKNVLSEDPSSKRSSECSKDKIIITDSFGPGFYGMETGDTTKIFELIDGSKISVVCKESGVMVPLKSCSGIYLIVDADTELPGINCEACLGNMMSCNMCNIRG